MELDDLLQESIQLKERSKHINRNLKSSEQVDLTYMLEDFWKTTFIGALFVKETCQCGNTSLHFSHFFAYQEFISKKLSKPRRMIRLERRPEPGTLSGSFFAERKAQGCAMCLNFTELLPINSTNKEN